MTYIVLKAPLNSNQPTNQPERGMAVLLAHIEYFHYSLRIRGE